MNIELDVTVWDSWEDEKNFYMLVEVKCGKSEVFKIMSRSKKK